MPAGNLQYERRGPFEATKEVFLQVVYLENLSKDFENNPNFATPRSVPSTIRSKTTVFPKRAVSCPGTPSQNKVKPLQSLFKPTVSSVPEQEQEPQGVSNQSTPASTMKKKKNEKSKDKSRRSSRSQSIFSIASSFFGPLALGSDVSLNRQISPALQTSHVFFADEDIPSPSVDSSFALPDDMLRKEAQKPWFVGPMTSGSTTPTTVLGPDEQILPSPDQPSPPAPSLVPSSELSPKRKVSPEREVSPVASGDSDESNLKGTSPTTGETTTSSTIPESTRRKSKFASIGSFLPSFSQSRRESIASFFKGARDLPSRLFKKSSKSTSPSPPQLRSTFKFTEKDTLPPKKIPLAKWQKAAKRRDKIFKIKSKWENLTSSGRVHRETRRRLSKEKEWKEYRAKLTGTQKLLAIMDDAKDKAWEWIDKRAEKKRREKLNAYKTMRDERRKSIVLVPVYRDYEIVARRESSYSGFGYTPEGSD
ncbi:hypothetical protein EYR41_009848 [Orbilia oligospora]|uniref:Uncharacterized protein n=1 Tax=Orbilia oligospora TaxID=2813651 RepID=A0A8H2HLG7_ORBOL|nr:hypothetical protein EYR41_009848 [Orbilia oligospora]